MCINRYIQKYIYSNIKISFHQILYPQNIKCLCKRWMTWVYTHPWMKQLDHSFDPRSKTGTLIFILVLGYDYEIKLILIFSSHQSTIVTRFPWSLCQLPSSPSTRTRSTVWPVTKVRASSDSVLIKPSTHYFIGNVQCILI